MTDDLAARSLRLLNEAQYLTMATTKPDGEPWAATIHYVWLADPLRLLFVSPTGASHSRNIAAQSTVAGSLFLTGLDTDVAIAPVDGAQFTGHCGLVTAGELPGLHHRFFEAVFPDPAARAEWMLPLAAFEQPSDHGLYRIDVHRWWLIDLRTWAEDKIDRRVEVPLGVLT